MTYFPDLGLSSCGVTRRIERPVNRNSYSGGPVFSLGSGKAFGLLERGVLDHEGQLLHHHHDVRFWLLADIQPHPELRLL